MSNAGIVEAGALYTVTSPFLPAGRFSKRLAGFPITRLWKTLNFPAG